MPPRPNDDVCPDPSRTKRSRLPAILLVGVLGAVSLLLTTQRISAERRDHNRSVPIPRDPGVGIAFARVRLEVRFPTYAFLGERFPEPSLGGPSPGDTPLGPCELRTTYLDPSGAMVEDAETPGPYGAIVEILPAEGRASRRYATLYRLKAPLPEDERFLPESPGALATAAGLPEGRLDRQADRIAARLGDRTYAQLAREPELARLLAGLAKSDDPEAEIGPWNDADATERRWWVEWKRRAGGVASRLPSPLIAPKLLRGGPSPVLRDGTPAEAGMGPERVEAIDALLREWAADSDQAFAVCLARQGVVFLHRAYGIRDGVPMTVNTKSWMASVTKPMNAMLMMMLVDDGRVTLDDRVADHLPALFRMTSSKPMTVRHLYTHTHGLDFWMRGRDETDDFEERVADCYHFVRAGQRWNYNAAGYTLAGKVIESLSGESLPECYRTHLLEPLGMDSTEVAGSYGDAWSTPRDIAAFGQMLLNGGSYGSWRFLRAPSYLSMLPDRLTAVLGPSSEKVWGIGLSGTRREFGHGAASSATFLVSLDDQTVIVMTRNAAGRNFGRYHERFLAAVKAAIAR